MRWTRWAPGVLLWIGIGCASTGPDQIRRMGLDQDVGALVEAYSHSEQESLRVMALEALSPYAADPQAGAVFVQAARSGRSTRERVVALKSLGRSDSSESTAVLIDALGDPQPPVRGAARASLARRGQVAHPELLRAVSEHPNPLTRSASVALLAATPGRPGESELIPQALLRAADDLSPLVRSEAVIGLGRLRYGPSHRILLRKRQSDPDRNVRMAAERALVEVGRSQEAVRPVVAVLPLRVAGTDPEGELSGLAETVVERVRARLAAEGVCEVIDKARMDAVLSELRKTGQLVYDGDAPNAPAIGHFKVANQLVYGSVVKRGSVYSIMVQRLNVATLELVPGGAVTASGYASELDHIISDVVDTFVRSFH